MIFEIKDNTIYITTKYNEIFIKNIKKYTDGKWNKDEKRWEVSYEFFDKVNEICIPLFGEGIDGDNVTIEYKATDFRDKPANNVHDYIKIGSFITVERLRRDSEVTLSKTIIVNGDFQNCGGSAKYPGVGDCDEVVLRSTIARKLYEALSDEEKSKISVVA